MSNNNLDLSVLRAVVEDAEQQGLMVCLSTKTLKALLRSAEDAEMSSILPKLQLMTPPSQMQ